MTVSTDTLNTLFLFQLTSSRGGWRYAGNRCRSSSHFNSHPHEEDDRRIWPYDRKCCISTHILTRRMTTVLVQPNAPKLFQLTSSRGGWRFMEEKTVWKITFQLTSSRGGWRYRFVDACRDSVISTHILTRRMTMTKRKKKQERTISTHILTRRMTRVQKNRKLVRRYFNSHPHEEDDNVQSCLVIDQNISTHILTRRMTMQEVITWLIQQYFNSHPHEEDDRKVGHIKQRTKHFNSHPHEEDDSSESLQKVWRSISTHILTRRMTYNLFRWYDRWTFQLTSSRGGWH